MIFYVIAASPMDVIIQISRGMYWFNLEDAVEDLPNWYNSKIYKVEIEEKK
jgi:hypothetical protein